ncbi:Chemotaxis protein methyltransferase CheR [Arcticibacter svalbardensis MN12-7]|uniref:protein-glutamate O-methyltransferase n=1 Tax=Arcticibacter svalbardensis MN12-7 TaxID=1150600 RepID=R9GMJ0_9SPHI|nr:CheR family methyltransferase [Arcticibacter svalbardensis]EOR92948.1 Chemotaxis protein methyltransferase CheR [Arcticibacter svalbardensis MN12-7]
MEIKKEALKRKSKTQVISASKQPDNEQQQQNVNFYIVCLGGSAGAFKAYETFFTHMPADSGMAFVLIMHLDPKHQGNLPELIQTYTSMPVLEAEDGMLVEKDQVYVIPPNRDMGMHERKLFLLKQSKPRGYSLPIDYFLQSLADDQFSKAVAVIFSGMGSDGETGVRMIKEKLGMAMVQDPGTATFDSMPLASINTNMVDYILPPEEMPIKLIQYVNHPILAEESNNDEQTEILNANAIQKILMLLRLHTGHDFSMYKKSTVIRRIDRRIAYHQLPDYGYYVNHLRENPHEIDILFNELLIGVTKFFRDANAYSTLKNKLTIILKNKIDEEPVRVWVAGCSTGEEAYSLAILLLECASDLKEKYIPKIQIFATDLDSDAIERARTGCYRDNIIADVSAERLDKYFTKKDDSYCVKKELREMIVFAQHNMIKDAPFTRLDLLSCRNVLIYLTSELQKKIIPIFHYSLKSTGLLLLGPAESIGGFSDMFVPIDVKWKLFARKEGSLNAGKIIDFPFHVNKQSINLSTQGNSRKGVKSTSIAETFNKILLESYTPASILVNEKGDILFINGMISRFMEFPQGEAVLNVNKMIKDELKYVLGNLIHQAVLQKTVVSIPDINIKEGDQFRIVSLKAVVLEERPLQGLILVMFEDTGLLKKKKESVNPKGQNNNKHIIDIEKELLYTKQQLHSTIEQMETSLEELKSTNEELQSTNEELQSTNEESLTTKEEMQSLNEELMTINVQYQSKAEELTQLNNDMKNLLDSTEIGTIFLDNNLDVLRFTPQVRKLFNLIPSDVGRSITHIVSNFETPLEEEIREVIENLLTKEIEVKTKNNEWYSVRIMPYRTLENFISGAVLTFSRITQYKYLEFKLNALKSYSAGIVNVLKEPAIQLDKNHHVITVNSVFLKRFHVEEQEIVGHYFIEFVQNNWNTDKLDAVLKLCKKQENGSLEIELENDEGLVETLEINAQPFIDAETSETLMVLIIINEVEIDKVEEKKDFKSGN